MAVQLKLVLTCVRRSQGLTCPVKSVMAGYDRLTLGRIDIAIPGITLEVRLVVTNAVGMRITAAGRVSLVAAAQFCCLVPRQLSYFPP